MNEQRKEKRFEILVRNAGGQIQLLVMDSREGSGIRALGGKGSPYASTIHTWKLSEEQMDRLIEDFKSVRAKKRPARKAKT